MSNILDTALRPTLFVNLSASLTNLTGNGTAYTVLFDNVISGSGTGYNPATGIFTAPYSGRALIGSSLFFNNIVNSANGNVTTIVINASAFRSAEYALAAAKSLPSRFVHNFGMPWNLNAGDTVKIVAQINNGSAASVGLVGGTSPYSTWLFIKYLP